MKQNEINTIADNIISEANKLKTEDDKAFDKNKANALKERGNRWHEISMNQLSFYNNLLIVLGTGFVAFVVKELKPLKTYFTLSEIQLQPTSISFSINFMVISVVFGLSCGFNRLVDFRYTHRVNNLRRKLYDKNPASYGKGNFEKKLNWSIRYWFIDADFFNANDTEYEGNAKEVKDKIDGCSKLIEQLGKFTRNLLRIQILFFMLCIIAFVISIEM